MRLGLLTAACGALLCATQAEAVQISLTGSLSIHVQGTTTALALNTNQSVNFADSTGRFSGTVRVFNNYNATTGVQSLGLELTSFRYYNNQPGAAETVTFTVEQLFTVANGAAAGTQSYQGGLFTSNLTAAGQLARVSSQSFQEGIELPRLDYNQAAAYSSSGGATPINLGTTTAQNLAVSGNYRIQQVWTFVTDTNAACNWMAIDYCQPAGGYANLYLVPLPAASWAGLSGLAGVAIIGGVRRKRLRG